MRLDIHLTKKYPEYSRSHLQKLIKSKAVLVNNKTVKPHYQLKPTDKITEKITPPKKIDLSPDKSKKLNIIHEDNNYLVINKPAGLVVHPSESVKSKTLVNLLIAHYPPIKNIGDHNPELRVASPELRRPGIVHRLDKDVSGLMVIAKTQDAFNNLKKQFKSHTIKKEYTCLVHGNVKKDSGIITTPIGRSHKGYKMSAHTQPKEKDKQAVTKYVVIKRYLNSTLNPSKESGSGLTLLKIQTLTGRTHQIRVHLSSIGHPILGDPIYKSKSKNRLSAISNQQSTIRVFLVADLLQFQDLQNHPKKFKLELPKELKNTLKNYE
ncbi:RluA family pseudouridine synthase [Candidatus Falkowbacteria bacterium]|nr:RluA family pseudouridine synthase [Candidatus Falkowbacteria bacterium]